MAALKMPLGVTGVMLPDMSFDEQLALLPTLGITHYTLRPRIIPPEQADKPWGNWGNHKFDLTPQRLVAEGKEIKKRLEDAGLIPFGTVPAVNVDAPIDTLKQHFEGAQIVGAGRVRIGAPAYPTGAFKYFDYLMETVEKYRRVIQLAKPFGQKVVIETHCYSGAASPALALNICRNFSHTEIGTIFDIANFQIEGNYVPNLAVAVLDRYIDHCHIGGTRRVTGAYDALGFRKAAFSSCALSEGDLHLPAWLKALHEAGHDVPLIIEDYSENVPGALRLTRSATELRRAIEAL